MAKKKLKKTANRGKPKGIKTTTPQPKTEKLILEDTDPAFDTPKVDLDDRAAEQATESEDNLKIIKWIGRVLPHKCPLCGAAILNDRATKACKVKRTRKKEFDQEKSQEFKDHEMHCFMCRNDFIAREYLPK